MKNLKRRNLKTILFVSLVLTLIACEKSDDLNLSDITGTYTGTLTTDVSGKSSSLKTANTATAIVSMFGDKIEVHCVSENFNETIMLEIYNHNDSIKVCLTGSDFETMYGHALGHHGNMNGNMGNMSTDWMQHMNDEHEQGDEHFGGFNMENNSFGYTFRMHNGEFYFQGLKN